MEIAVATDPVDLGDSDGLSGSVLAAFSPEAADSVYPDCVGVVCLFSWG